jgi:hypothetical protein
MKIWPEIRGDSGPRTLLAAEFALAKTYGLQRRGIKACGRPR